MPALIDLCGRTFDQLTVLSRASNIGNSTAWLCRCKIAARDDLYLCMACAGERG